MIDPRIAAAAKAVEDAGKELTFRKKELEATTTMVIGEELRAAGISVGQHVSLSAYDWRKTTEPYEIGEIGRVGYSWREGVGGNVLEVRLYPLTKSGARHGGRSAVYVPLARVIKAVKGDEASESS
jgi:hypothetical protein